MPQQLGKLNNWPARKRRLFQSGLSIVLGSKPRIALLALVLLSSGVASAANSETPAVATPPTVAPVVAVKQPAATSPKASGSPVPGIPAKVLGQHHRVENLFFTSNAKELAPILNAMTKQVRVVAVSDRQLLMISDNANDPDWEQLGRLVAKLDQPKAQAKLTMWLFQYSLNARKLKSAPNAANSFSSASQQISALTSAASVYLSTVMEGFQSKIHTQTLSGGAGNSDYVDYIEKELHECSTNSGYCLGYKNAFGSARESLAQALFVLSSNETTSVDSILADAITHAKGALKELEEVHAKSCSYEGNWLTGVRGKTKGYTRALPKPFEGKNFKRALNAYLDTKPYVRKTFADYLFHYKWAIQHPDKFIHYDFRHSAAAVDLIFQPIIEALQTDISETLDFIAECRPNHDFRFVAKTEAATITGQPLKMSGSASSYYEQLQAADLNTSLNERSGDVSLIAALAEQVTDLAMLEKIAVNALLGQTKQTVELTSGVNMDVSSHSLGIAPGIELDIELSTGKESDQVLAKIEDKNAPISRLGRVYSDQKVRVINNRLFHLNSLGFDLTSPRNPWVIPGLGQIWDATLGNIPLMSGWFTIQQSPAEFRHQSQVVVNALVAPTAAALSLGLRFDRDRIELSNDALLQLSKRWEAAVAKKKAKFQEDREKASSAASDRLSQAIELAKLAKDKNSAASTAIVTALLKQPEVKKFKAASTPLVNQCVSRAHKPSLCVLNFSAAEQAAGIGRETKARKDSKTGKWTPKQDAVPELLKLKSYSAGAMRYHHKEMLEKFERER